MTSYWPLGIISAFLMTFILNGLLVYSALSTNDAPIDTDYYEKGLQYQRILDLKREMKNLGLSSSINIESAQLPHKKIIEVSVLKDGVKVNAKNIELKLLRPGDSKLDRTVLFDPSDKNEPVFSSIIDLPRGLWLSTLKFDIDGKRYQESSKIFAP